MLRKREIIARLSMTVEFLISKLTSRKMRMKSSVQLIPIRLSEMLLRSNSNLMLSRKSTLRNMLQNQLLPPRKRKRKQRLKRRKQRLLKPRKIEKITHHQSQLPSQIHQRLRLPQLHLLLLICHQSLLVLSAKVTCHLSSLVLLLRRDKKCWHNKWLKLKSLLTVTPPTATATVIEE